ncbi:MAG: phage tail length tape measure family protein, partial [Rhodospirillales bacterium]|nr:phage tail length tape measure family protein [Rhodospirillales bacterium]
MPIGSDTEIIVQMTAETAQLQAGMDAGAASVTSSTDAIKASVADTAASVAASQAEMTASVAGAATTWREFVTERMGEYMRLEGGHAAAMKRMGAEWAQYKTTLAGAGEASVKTGATIAASTEEAAAAVTAANTVIGESADAAANRIRAMVRASLEQVSANSIVGESERSLAERQGLRVEATQAEIAATAEAVAAQNAQMVAVEEFIGAQTEQVAITEADTVAIVENTGAKVLNARVSGELGTMLGEVLSGNFGRLRRSAGALANQSGLLARAFTGMGPPILAAAGAVIAFGVAIVKGAEEQAKFNGALLMTGGSTGVLAGDLQDMTERVGEASGSFGNAKEAMLAIVESGRITGDEMQSVGIAAQQMAALTGESIQKSVDAFVKLQEKPVQAVAALNDKYHFLTTAIFDQIAALQKQGDTEDAAKLATEAYAKALQDRST